MVPTRVDAYLNGTTVGFSSRQTNKSRKSYLRFFNHLVTFFSAPFSWPVRKEGMSTNTMLFCVELASNLKAIFALSVSSHLIACTSFVQGSRFLLTLTRALFVAAFMNYEGVESEP